MAKTSGPAPLNFAQELKGVVNKEGQSVSVESFTGNDTYVALYFSAHWCPPCQIFTPQLAEFYKNVKAKGLEIVFISADNDEESFKEYFATMPWLAVRFEDRDTEAKLSEKFDVQGIPKLVLLDGKTGKVLIGNARKNVSDDPTGSKFPWQ